MLVGGGGCYYKIYLSKSIVLYPLNIEILLFKHCFSPLVLQKPGVEISTSKTNHSFTWLLREGLSYSQVSCLRTLTAWCWLLPEWKIHEQTRPKRECLLWSIFGDHTSHWFYRSVSLNVTTQIWEYQVARIIKGRVGEQVQNQQLTSMCIYVVIKHFCGSLFHSVASKITNVSLFQRVTSRLEFRRR